MLKVETILAAVVVVDVDEIENDCAGEQSLPLLSD
jgi:hypothetical protein